MKGYFFALECIIAILLVLFPIFYYSNNFFQIDNKEEKIYRSLEILRESNLLEELNSTKIEAEIENLTNFDVCINFCTDKKLNKKLNYVFVNPDQEPKIIEIYY
ncbi:MAG: hypothetical protein B6U88_00960 [Candidatus Aenigmarchaeota archaeon ex4484_56]|nr:MAG: hypothetical protein B6U88_00960 [Candidatus Aenigmarchaeota archaeon ex4484_56]